MVRGLRVLWTLCRLTRQLRRLTSGTRIRSSGCVRPVRWFWTSCFLPQSAATAGDSAALSASSAATVPMPQSAATAVVQPASGSNPAWLERCFLAKEAQEWEWVKIEKEEKEKVVNSKPKTEHVTNLAMLARRFLRSQPKRKKSLFISRFWRWFGNATGARRIFF